jgi:hypothetical protein
VKKEKIFLRNADNESLMPWGNGKVVIGYVEEVNGKSAGKVAGFVPTRHELIQLVKYWQRKALEQEYSWFLSGQVGSTETRRHAFALRRVASIWDLLGEEEIQQTTDRVYAEFGEGTDPRLWDIFLHGDEVARKAVWKETSRLMAEE